MTSAVPLPSVPSNEYGHEPKIAEGGEMFGRDHTETWAAAIDGWTTSLRVSRSPTTIRQRRWQLRKLAEAYPQRHPFKISLDELEAWLGGQEWNAESRKSARSAVRSFYAWAIKTGRAKKNPAERLDPISVPRRLPRPAGDATLMRALDGADDRLTLMLLLAAQAGLRVHEIAKLRWDDIDGGEWLLVRGKRDRERRVGIPSRLLAALTAERARRESGHLGSGFRYGQGDPMVFVFPGLRGGMNPAWVSDLISKALGDGTTAHMLRHRAATVALDGTKNLAAVQDFLGHAKPETTRIYARVGDDALRAVADSL